jgi:hypothetical protein
MKRQDAIPYVSFLVNDALHAADMVEMGSDADAIIADPRTRLVGWQCGFEPLFVAVYSYLPNVRVSEEEAQEIAKDYLLERGWFSDPDADNDPDYVF